MSFLVKDNVFRKNDIRGIVGKEVTPELYKQIGMAYVQYITEKDPSLKEKKDEIWVSVAMDARHHSPEMAQALIEGLTLGGINVLDLGLCPTPIAYFSEYIDLSRNEFDLLKTGKAGFSEDHHSRLRNKNIKNIMGSFVVTASHNPPNYNGLKMTFRKVAISEAELARMEELTRNSNFTESSSSGMALKYDLISDYADMLVKSFANKGKGVKIVVDSGNATAGVVAPELYRKMGCEVIDIFTEPDGDFPNHHPNPSEEKNIRHLKEKVAEVNADFGIAFDGDSDRVGIIDNTGYSIPGDQLLLIFALDILNNPEIKKQNPVFISEVKCSQVMYDTIEENGGRAIMWKTGHAYIKSKMKEENAILAGEMSGHIFFRDSYYGFDDAIYAGCRFIRIMAAKKAENPDFKASDIIEQLPKVCTSDELRYPCSDELKFKIIDELKANLEKNPDLLGIKIEKFITLDGIRFVFKNGFGLIRASNTEPTFTLRFEGKTQEDLNNYTNAVLKVLEAKMSSTAAL